MAVDGVPDGWEVVTPQSSEPEKPVNATAQFMKGPQAVVDVPEGGSGNALQRLAHPQTDSDVMALITAPVDSTRGVIANLPTIAKAAKDTAVGVKNSIVGTPQAVKQQAGNLLMSVAHPADTLDRIAKHLIGTSEPDPMELQAAKNELAAMRLKLQTARSVGRQADIAKRLPVASALQTDASKMADALHKATSTSGLVDSAGKPIASAATLPEGSKSFVQSIKDQIDSGKKLSGAQYQVLQRIYQTVFK